MGDQERAWPLGAYAPGGYMCRCATCGQEFTGDKRAVSCLECAVRAVNSRIRSLEGENARLTLDRDGWKDCAHALTPRAQAAEASLAKAVEGLENWKRQYFEQLEVVDRMQDRATEAETTLHSPRTVVMSAAWALCDDTEGTVHHDEFGDHYRVPKDSWDRLANALEAVDASEPTIIQKLRAELVEAHDARRLAEDSAQRLYEQNGDARAAGALQELIRMWEGDDWVVDQEGMLAIARETLAAIRQEPKG